MKASSWLPAPVYGSLQPLAFLALVTQCQVPHGPARELPDLVLPAGGFGIRPQAALALRILPRATCPVPRQCNVEFVPIVGRCKAEPWRFSLAALISARLSLCIFNFCKQSLCPEPSGITAL